MLRRRSRSEGVPSRQIQISYQVDLRYHGQGLR
jgi:hypothetical protein